MAAKTLQRLGAQPGIQRSAHGQIIQRLKQGDFVELAPFGLDVGTWDEFIAALKKVDRLGLTMISRLLEQRELDEDTFQARRLVEQRKRELNPRRYDLVDHWFGDNSRLSSREEEQRGHAKATKAKKEAPSESLMQQANMLHAEKSEKNKLVICDGVKELTVIRSASDLLVWLVSHPIGSAKTPKSFADPKILIKVLVKLGREDRVVNPAEVWDALRAVVEPDSEEEVSSEDENGFFATQEDSSDESWEEGDWDEVAVKGDDPFGLKAKSLFDIEEDTEKVPSEFRRVMKETEYNEKLAALGKRLAGHKLVGVHATTIENLGPLMQEGVSPKKMGSGHGVGKGNGFYIIPTQKGVRDLTKAEKAAKGWGRSIVAVYMPEDCEFVKAKEGENVQTLEGKNKGQKYIYLFGEEEAVIPPSLFNQIILVRDPADITMADPRLPVTPSKESAVGFLNKLNRPGEKNRSKKQPSKGQVLPSLEGLSLDGNRLFDDVALQIFNGPVVLNGYQVAELIRLLGDPVGQYVHVGGVQLKIRRGTGSLPRTDYNPKGLSLVLIRPLRGG